MACNGEETLDGVTYTDIDVETRLTLIAALPPVPDENVDFTNIDRLLSLGYPLSGASISQADWPTLPANVQS